MCYGDVSVVLTMAGLKIPALESVNAVSALASVEEALVCAGVGK